MDINVRDDVHCGRKDGRADGRTENRTPVSHLAKAGATKTTFIDVTTFIENRVI